jgi:hypothetical protein
MKDLSLQAKLLVSMGALLAIASSCAQGAGLATPGTGGTRTTSTTASSTRTASSTTAASSTGVMGAGGTGSGTGTGGLNSLGAPCGSNDECASSFCVGIDTSKICCALPCADHGAASCGSNGACKADGSACAVYAAGTPCSSDCFFPGLFRQFTCDGTSKCVAPQDPTHCAGGLGCKDTKSCNASCTTDADCEIDYFCKSPGTDCAPTESAGSTCTRNGECASMTCALADGGMFCK